MQGASTERPLKGYTTFRFYGVLMLETSHVFLHANVHVHVGRHKKYLYTYIFTNVSVYITIRKTIDLFVIFKCIKYMQSCLHANMQITQARALV